MANAVDRGGALYGGGNVEGVVRQRARRVDADSRHSLALRIMPASDEGVDVAREKLLRWLFPVGERTAGSRDEEPRVLRITWRARLGVAGILIAALGAVTWAVAVAPSNFVEDIPSEQATQLAAADRLEAEDRRRQSQNAVRNTLVQAIGGMVLALGLAATWVTVLINRQSEITNQQGQITERFTRAVDQIGNKDSVDVRLGGIYALQRIAHESSKDRPAIVNILAAFVRGHASGNRSSGVGWPGAPQHRDEWRPVLERAPDAHAAAVALGELHQSDEPLSLAGVDLIGIHWRSANLRGADLQQANFWNADLQAADLSGAILWEANLFAAKLVAAKLVRSILWTATLTEADLTEAIVTGANLRGALLERSKLRGTDLSNANLGMANMTYSDLRRATLAAADMYRAVIYEADLREADLRGADLGHADLRGADLRHADLRGADLRNADLRRAKLQDANLADADLDGANMQGAVETDGTHWPLTVDPTSRGVVRSPEA